jgi:hypothetical protein
MIDRVTISNKASSVFFAVTIIWFFFVSMLLNIASVAPFLSAYGCRDWDNEDNKGKQKVLHDDIVNGRHTCVVGCRKCL